MRIQSREPCRSSERDRTLTRPPARFGVLVANVGNAVTSAIPAGGNVVGQAVDTRLWLSELYVHRCGLATLQFLNGFSLIITTHVIYQCT